MKVTVTCRYGITYTTQFVGSKAAIARTAELMTRCCCWCCHNRKCQEPRNEILPDCHNVCELWTGDEHYCTMKVKTK